MGAFENTVTVDVYRKHGSVPLGGKGTGAQGTPVFFGCNVQASADQPRDRPYGYGNGDHPPRHVVLLIKPVHFTGRQ